MRANQDKTREKLRQLAKEVLSKMETTKKPIIQFCGPISMGGFGSASDNLEFMNSIIRECEKTNIPVFNQLSYEKEFNLILGEPAGYDYPLLDSFYEPVLSSGKIKGLFFLPLWQTSFGSRWEHAYAQTCKIEIFYLERVMIDEIKNFYSLLERKLS